LAEDEEAAIFCNEYFSAEASFVIFPKRLVAVYLVSYGVSCRGFMYKGREAKLNIYPRNPL
jgi:hypothetical protein